MTTLVIAPLGWIGGNSVVSKLFNSVVHDSGEFKELSVSDIYYMLDHVYLIEIQRSERYSSHYSIDTSPTIFL